MTQTNTTQNKEELEALSLDRIYAIQQEFIKKLEDTTWGSVAFDILLSEQRAKLYKLVQQAHQSGIEEERKRIKANIGFLRQWLNEKPEKMLVTNEDIEEWLFDFEPLRGNKQ